MTWTPEREGLLRKLVAEGISYSNIADRMGGITRSAAIGKAQRLGIAGIKTSSQSKYPRSRTRRSQKSKSPLRDAGSIPPAGRASPKPASAPTRKRTKHNLGPATEEQKAKAVETLAKALAPQDCDPPPDERIGLMELNGQTCRWPCGELGDKDFGYCGRHSEIGTPYCENHSAIAFAGRPARKTQDSRRVYQPNQEANYG